MAENPEPVAENPEPIAEKSEPIAEKPEVTYPCCGKGDHGEFMIQCDKCDTWLHGHCIQLKPWFAPYIKSFYCNECMNKDPSVHIIFTKIYQQLVGNQNKSLEEIMALRCGTCLTCVRVKNNINCKTCMRCKQNQPKMCLALHCINPPEDAIKSSTRRSTGTRTAGKIPKSPPMKKNAPTRKKPRLGAGTDVMPTVEVENGTNIEPSEDVMPTVEVGTNIEPPEDDVPKRRGRKRKQDELKCDNMNCKKKPSSGSRFCSTECARDNAKHLLSELISRSSDAIMAKEARTLLNEI